VEAAGIAVGEMEMINLNTGQKKTFHIDGTVVTEQSAIKIDWCDKCEKWKSMEFGRYEQSDGITLLWFCQECK
jgi:hypothetical protein